jgi:hypothetical protein
MFMLILWAAVVIAVWLVPIVLVVKLTGDDGRDSAKWGCLSVIFGWPVLVIYLVTRNDSADAFPSTPVYAPKPMRRCPSCGEPIPALATVCRVCDTRIDPAAEPIPAKRWSWSGPSRTCPHCHRETPEANETCVNCGQMSSI